VRERDAGGGEEAGRDKNLYEAHGSQFAIGMPERARA
jgi:hypothetical protein